MTADAVDQALVALLEIIRAHAHFDPNLPPDIRVAWVHLVEARAEVSR